MKENQVSERQSLLFVAFVKHLNGFKRSNLFEKMHN